ncbi:hypothetical protein GC1_08825 [Leisingera sp. ANG1]|nr:hypothetical protein RA23_17135 [Leisingera sp. ANG-S3]KIC49421.1 hypothetical protein RA22_20725 [Leisingera sp. ANG-S]KID09462.1 hypothetical protein GC1_08825 [Leisingera sp. ANG1]
MLVFGEALFGEEVSDSGAGLANNFRILRGSLRPKGRIVEILKIFYISRSGFLPCGKSHTIRKAGIA